MIIQPKIQFQIMMKVIPNHQLKSMLLCLPTQASPIQYLEKVQTESIKMQTNLRGQSSNNIIIQYRAQNQRLNWSSLSLLFCRQCRQFYSTLDKSRHISYNQYKSQTSLFSPRSHLEHILKIFGKITRKQPHNSILLHCALTSRYQASLFCGPLPPLNW